MWAEQPQADVRGHDHLAPDGRLDTPQRNADHVFQDMVRFPVTRETVHRILLVRAGLFLRLLRIGHKHTEEFRHQFVFGLLFCHSGELNQFDFQCTEPRFFRFLICLYPKIA